VSNKESLNTEAVPSSDPEDELLVGLDGLLAVGQRGQRDLSLPTMVHNATQSRHSSLLETASESFPTEISEGPTINRSELALEVKSTSISFLGYILRERGGCKWYIVIEPRRNPFTIPPTWTSRAYECISLLAYVSL